MSFTVRDSQFDVALVAGPRISLWPSAGVRAISAFCAEMGLTVGFIGGEGLRARGVLPWPGTGGVILADDAQNRIHRIQARAVVRFVPRREIPDAFPGWLRSGGVLPLSTALRLQEAGTLLWHPSVVILGAGNRAFRFGSSLLKKGVGSVICLSGGSENFGLKKVAAWEVEKRQFEILGGKFVDGIPLGLSVKSPGVFEFRFQSASSILSLEVSRVISAGPFQKEGPYREHPPGSLLFEVEQTALRLREEDLEGWVLEEERGRFLATKISKALVTDLGGRREELKRVYRRSRDRLKLCDNHLLFPFQVTYDGKWTQAEDAKKIRSCSSIPARPHPFRPIAAIECFESIPCDLCAKACPEAAIEWLASGKKRLMEADCTACGLCLSACPSGSIVLIQEKESAPSSPITFVSEGFFRWKVGDFAQSVNRRGEDLASSGRVIAVSVASSGEPKQLVQVAVPGHLLWEARGIRPQAHVDLSNLAYQGALEAGTEGKVELWLNGEKRLVREGIPVSLALFETLRHRPSDLLFCSDGSCGLCAVEVDGARGLACQTAVRRGMSIRFSESKPEFRSPDKNVQKDPQAASLCACLGIPKDEVLEKVKQGKLQSPDAVLAATHVGEGRCHGQLCMESFRRVLSGMGLDVAAWIDWRLPWADWKLTPGAHD